MLAVAIAAGAIGTTGLLALFQSVILAKMSIAMPVSALLAAALPVLVGSLVEGFPGVVTFLGFLLALAGIGFGSIFILMDVAARTATLWPMLASRSGGMLIVAIYILFRRDSWRLARDAWPILLLTGFLDVSGTAFYVLASQAGRLDVAAVISSLYPGMTVLLAALVLKERVSRSQFADIFQALTAIIFLTV